ncbi:MAG: helix-turn-helix domain-containing protein [Thermoplasmata archaeon]
MVGAKDLGPLRLATVHLRIPDRTWTGPFSRRHPEARIEILNREELGSGHSVSDHWITGRPPGLWREEIAAYPDVVSAVSIAEVGEGTLYRVTFRSPAIVDLYRRLRLPLPLPLRIQAGSAQWEVVARNRQFAEVLRFARKVDPSARFVSIRRRPLRAHLPLLTAAQNALFTEARTAGYFAIPPATTLAALARKLGRDRIAVSSGLAVIEKKLLRTSGRQPPRFP